MNISVLEAERILSHFKSGVVPPSGIEYLTFGRDELIAQTRSMLENANNGETTSMVIKGGNGTGKSHTCAIISKMALEAGFAVSSVNVDEELSWNKILQTYNHVLMNVQVPDLPDITGIKLLLREWMRNDTQARLLDRLQSDLEGEFTVVPDKLRYGVKAIAYFYDRAERNILSKQDALEKEDVLIQWLTGEKVHTTKVIRDILVEVFKKLGIRALTLKEDNISEMLEGFVKLLRFIGYPGLIVLIDEGENSSEGSSNYAQRAKIYRDLDELLSDRTIEHLLTFFAISPPVLLNIANDYEEHKISLPQFITRSAKIADGVHDLKPLSLPEMHKLATAIRQLHSTAYDWSAQEPLSDETISELCEKMRESGLPIRHLIRSIIEALDTAKQSPNPNITTDILNADVYEEAEKTDVFDKTEEAVATKKIITETIPETEPVKKEVKRKSTSTRTRKKEEPEFIPVEPLNKASLTHNERMAISTVREYLIVLEEGYQQTPPNVLICETAIKALQRTNQFELIQKMKGKIPVSKVINNIFSELDD